MDLDVNKLGVDLLTLNGLKFTGQRSWHFYLRKGVRLKPIIFGGGQGAICVVEQKMFPTLWVFCQALELAENQREARFLAHCLA